MFQIGELERGIGQLVVDEDGEVYAIGHDYLYAGVNIGEAIRTLREGHRMGSA